MYTKIELTEAIEEALKRNNVKRDALWNERITTLIVQVMEKTNVSIDKRIQHLKSSPETRKELDKLKEFCECQEITNGKIDEMHKFFVGAKFTRKFVVGMFVFLGTIASSIVAIKLLVKNCFK